MRATVAAPRDGRRRRGRVATFSVVRSLRERCEVPRTLRDESLRGGNATRRCAPLRLAAKQVEVQRPVEVLRTAASQPEAAPAAPPAPVEDDSLELVAKCLERDDLPGATTYLDTYVRAHPDQPLFRLQLAELCL